LKLIANAFVDSLLKFILELFLENYEISIDLRFIGSLGLIPLLGYVLSYYVITFSLHSILNASSICIAEETRQEN